MRRFSNRPQQRKRQTWSTIPASGIEEVGHGQDWKRAICENRREADRVRREGVAAPTTAGHPAWNGIEEISEAVQNLVLNAHALGPTLSYQAIESPRHKIKVRENVAQMIQAAGQRKAARLDIEEA